MTNKLFKNIVIPFQKRLHYYKFGIKNMYTKGNFNHTNTMYATLKDIWKIYFKFAVFDLTFTQGL